VAAAIVRTAEWPRPTTVIGAAAHAIRLSHFLAPEWSTWLTSRFIQRYLRTAPAAPVTDGNLFQPPADPGGIYGGLSTPEQRAAQKAATAGLTIAAALGVAMLLLRSPSSRRSVPW
jgi:hypothetical protein